MAHERENPLLPVSYPNPETQDYQSAVYPRMVVCRRPMHQVRPTSPVYVAPPSHPQFK